MSTINDVAKAAGVSITTISRVINGDLKVKPETEQKIMTAIKEMEYRPNAVARGLRIKETKTLGLILPSISNPFYPEIARGVEDYASSKGYHVLLCNSDRNMLKQKIYIKTLLEKQIDGIIFVNSEINEDDISVLMANDISVVLNQPCDFPQVDEVWIDYTHAAEEMTKYLLGIGHTRVALINGPASLKRCKERLAGFIKGHEIMGINYSKEIIKNGDFSMDSAYKHTQKLMSLQVPPSCIFTTDFMALGVLNAAADLGLKVPDHLSVAGSDNIATSHPRLTTIDNSSYDMGKIMAKLAISRRKSKKSIEKRSIRLDTKVIVRESTKICEKL